MDTSYWADASRPMLDPFSYMLDRLMGNEDRW